MEIGAGLKATDLHGLDQALEFELKNIQVPVGEQQQMTQFVGQPQGMHGLPQGNDRHRGDKGDQTDDNGVGFQGDQAGENKTLTSGDQRAEPPEGLTRIGERQD